MAEGELGFGYLEVAARALVCPHHPAVRVLVCELEGIDHSFIQLLCAQPCVTFTDTVVNRT